MKRYKRVKTKPTTAEKARRKKRAMLRARCQNYIKTHKFIDIDPDADDDDLIVSDRQPFTSPDVIAMLGGDPMRFATLEQQAYCLAFWEDREYEPPQNLLDAWAKANAKEFGTPEEQAYCSAFFEERGIESPKELLDAWRKAKKAKAEPAKRSASSR